MDKLAYSFARKQNTITLIFNHASTAELHGYKEDEDQSDPRYWEYQNDIYGVDYEEMMDVDGGNVQRRISQVHHKNMFYMEGDKLLGIAVLININFGLNKYKSVATRDELFAHIRYIREATKKN